MQERAWRSNMSIEKNAIMQQKVISEIDAVVFGRSITTSATPKPHQPGTVSAVISGAARALRPYGTDPFV